jgi:AbrB family looped-hinge helix DNA binding protein
MATVSSSPKGRRARLTRQGQITVPKAIRDALGLRPGDEIEFVPRGSELLVEARPRRSVLEFAGIAAPGTQVPATAEELDTLIAEGMRDAAVARQRRVSAAWSSSRSR